MHSKFLYLTVAVFSWGYLLLTPIITLDLSTDELFFFNACEKSNFDPKQAGVLIRKIEKYKTMPDPVDLCRIAKEIIEENIQTRRTKATEAARNTKKRSALVITFKPTPPEKLESTRQRLRDNPTIYTDINKAYEVNDRMDDKEGVNQLEECFYASIVNAKNSKQAGLDSYYYLMRSLIAGDNETSSTYLEAQRKLKEALISSYGVTKIELKDIRIKAYADNFIEYNVYAQNLKRHNREDLVEAVARVKVTRSPESRAEAKALFENLIEGRPDTDQTITDYVHLATQITDGDLNKEFMAIIKKNTQ